MTITRDQAITEARSAADRAKSLAREADNAAHNRDLRDRVQHLAAAGSLWADTARAYADLAQALREPVTADDEKTED